MKVDLKTPVGRADLARMVACGCADDRGAGLARLCGFEPAPESEPPPPVFESRAAAVEAVRELPELRETAAVPEAKLGFWRVVSVEMGEEAEDPEAPEWFRKAGGITREWLKKERRPADRGPFPLLTEWPRLWPFLKRELSEAVDRGGVDTARLVRDIAVMRPIRTLPRKRVMRWAGQIHVLVDTSEPLRPFYEDAKDLVRRLRALSGRHRLKVFVFPSGLAAPGYRTDTEDPPAPYGMGDLRVAALALSDLGAYAPDPNSEARLLAIGNRLVKAGGRATALVPAPKGQWCRSLQHAWRMAWWDRGQKPRVPSRGQPGAEPEERSLEKGVGRDRLLALAAPIVRLDAELLRYLRALFPLKQTDAGMESALYCGRLDPRSHLNALVKEPFPVREALLELLCRFHADVPEILGEEQTILMYADPELGTKMKERGITPDRINAELAASLENERWRTAGYGEDELPAYSERRERRLPEAAYADPKVAVSWVMRHRTEDGGVDTAEVPDSIPWDKAVWALKSGAPRKLELVQEGDRLAIRSGEEGRGAKQSPLVEITTAAGALLIRSRGEEGKRRRLTWNLGEPGPRIFTHHFSDRSYEVESGGNTLHIEQIQKPSWAEEMGRDENGLFDARVLYWLSPGRYWFYGGHGAARVNRERGAWVSENCYHNYLKNNGLSVDWEEHLGEDEFGLYEDMPIHGVTQHFRWIEPGEFLMGSPGSEPERNSNERPHEVVLTKGFWLADTACTQALWQAVMGENPSSFKGDVRPVERVSWEDCQKFFSRVNSESPHLNLRFPTEAEWEYACRAGTTTPFSFGEMMSTNQVNFDGSHPYAGGAKGPSASHCGQPSPRPLSRRMIGRGRGALVRSDLEARFSPSRGVRESTWGACPT